MLWKLFWCVLLKVLSGWRSMLRLWVMCIFSWVIWNWIGGCISRTRFSFVYCMMLNRCCGLVLVVSLIWVVVWVLCFWVDWMMYMVCCVWKLSRSAFIVAFVWNCKCIIWLCALFLSLVFWMILSKVYCWVLRLVLRVWCVWVDMKLWVCLRCWISLLIIGFAT